MAARRQERYGRLIERALATRGLTERMREELRAFRDWLEATPGRGGRPRAPSTVYNYVRNMAGVGAYLAGKGYRSFFPGEGADLVAFETLGRDLYDYVLHYKGARHIRAGKRSAFRPVGRASPCTRARIAEAISVFYGRFALYYYEHALRRPAPEAELARMVRPIREDFRVTPASEVARRVKRPSDLPTDEEIRALIRAAGQRSRVPARDMAIVALLAETGVRVGELASLRLRDVEATEYGFRLSVSGKTGSRTVIVVEAAPYLRAWLNLHPNPEDPDAPLFPKVFATNGPAGEPLDEDTIYAIIRAAARRAGLRRRIWPHLLRHAAATRYARSGHISEAVLRRITVSYTHLTLPTTERV